MTRFIPSKQSRALRRPEPEIIFASEKNCFRSSSYLLADFSFFLLLFSSFARIVREKFVWHSTRLSSSLLHDSCLSLSLSLVVFKLREKSSALECARSPELKLCSCISSTFIVSQMLIQIYSYCVPELSTVYEYSTVVVVSWNGMERNLCFHWGIVCTASLLNALLRICCCCKPDLLCFALLCFCCPRASSLDLRRDGDERRGPPTCPATAAFPADRRQLTARLFLLVSFPERRWESLRESSTTSWQFIFFINTHVSYAY